MPQNMSYVSLPQFALQGATLPYLEDLAPAKNYPPPAINPDLENLARSSADIDNLFKAAAGGDYFQALNYQDKLKEYLKQYHAIVNPRRATDIPIQRAPSGGAMATAPVTDIYSFLRGRDLSWDQDGVVYYRGHRMKGTNINALIDAYANPIKWELAGKDMPVGFHFFQGFMRKYGGPAGHVEEEDKMDARPSRETLGEDIRSTRSRTLARIRDSSPPETRMKSAKKYGYSRRK